MRSNAPPIVSAVVIAFIWDCEGVWCGVFCFRRASLCMLGLRLGIELRVVFRGDQVHTSGNRYPSQYNNYLTAVLITGVPCVPGPVAYLSITMF